MKTLHAAKDPPLPSLSEIPADAPAIPAGVLPGRPWRHILHAVLWLLAAECSAFVVAAVAGAVAGITGAITHSHGWAGWTPNLLFYGAVATIALQGTLLLADLKQGRSVGRGNVALGLGAVPIRRLGLVALFAGLMVGWVIAYIVTLIRFQAFNAYVATRVPSMLTMPAAAGPVLLGFTMVLAVAIAPVAEELFFRGWLWTALRRSWGVWPTACWTAGLWLAIHAIDGPVRALILLPTAILLCLARHYGGSVRASLLVHIVNNSTAVAIQIAARMLAG